MRKTKDNSCFVAAWSGPEKLIVNLVDNDHAWREAVIRVSGAWEATAQKDRGVGPTTWNQGANQHVGVSVTTEVQDRVQFLLQIDFDHRN